MVLKNLKSFLFLKIFVFFPTNKFALLHEIHCSHRLHDVCSCCQTGNNTNRHFLKIVCRRQVRTHIRVQTQTLSLSSGPSFCRLCSRSNKYHREKQEEFWIKSQAVGQVSSSCSSLAPPPGCFFLWTHPVAVCIYHTWPCSELRSRLPVDSCVWTSLKMFFCFFLSFNVLPWIKCVFFTHGHNFTKRFSAVWILSKS